MVNPTFLSSDRLALMFPGFDVSPQDFVEENGMVFRMNSDGTRHSLEKWSFDGQTGEFFRITGKDHDSVFVETMTYAERKVDLRKAFQPGQDKGAALAAMHNLLVAVLGLAALGLILIAVGFSGAFGEGQRANPVLPNLIAMLVGGVFLYLAYMVFKKKAPDMLDRNVIGPQPLKRLPLKAPVNQQPAARPAGGSTGYSGKMS